MKKISGAFLIVTLHAVLVVGQNGVLECGCFQTVSDSRPNSTSFEDSMSTCVYRCKIEPTCVAVAFSVSKKILYIERKLSFAPLATQK